MPTSAKTFPTPDCRRVTLRRAGHADHEAVATLLREVDCLPPGWPSGWIASGSPNSRARSWP
jgi:hypothetical protein